MYNSIELQNGHLTSMIGYLYKKVERYKDVRPLNYNMIVNNLSSC